MTTTITHSEISAVTAARIKSTPEAVAKTVTEYAKSAFDLSKEKKPTNAQDILLTETPLVAYRTKYKPTGVMKNPDGTEKSIGENWTVNAAVPKTFIHGLNEGVIDGVAKLASGALNLLKKTAS